jgi:hypothetical protein
MNFAIIDRDDVVIRTGECPESQLVHQLFNPGERIVTMDAKSRVIANGRYFWDNEALTFRERGLSSGELDDLRAKAMVEIDAGAELARQGFLTPGAGQAIEYRLTEEEARRFLSSGLTVIDRDDYPMLDAEAQTRPGVGGTIIAQGILDRARASAQALATIKGLRRAAKVALAAAESREEVLEICRVPWPQGAN